MTRSARILLSLIDTRTLSIGEMRGRLVQVAGETLVDGSNRPPLASNVEWGRIQMSHQSRNPPSAVASTRRTAITASPAEKSTICVGSHVDECRTRRRSATSSCGRGTGTPCPRTPRTPGVCGRRRVHSPARGRHRSVPTSTRCRPRGSARSRPSPRGSTESATSSVAPSNGCHECAEGVRSIAGAVGGGSPADDCAAGSVPSTAASVPDGGGSVWVGSVAGGSGVAIASETTETVGSTTAGDVEPGLEVGAASSFVRRPDHADGGGAEQCPDHADCDEPGRVLWGSPTQSLPNQRVPTRSFQPVPPTPMVRRCRPMVLRSTGSRTVYTTIATNVRDLREIVRYSRRES